MRKKLCIALALGLLVVLSAGIQPISAQLTCPPDIERGLKAREPRLSDEILEFYNSWSVKELKAGRKPGKGFTVAVGVGALINDTSLTAFWESIRRLQDLGAKVIYFAGTAGFQSPENAAIMENFIAQNPDAIEYVFCNSQVLAPALQKAAMRKIPVFGLDNWLSGPSVVGEVTCDNFDIGRKAARYVIERLGGKGNVVECFSPGHRGNEIRNLMWQIMIKQYPDIKELAVIGTQSANLTLETRDRMEALLLANPKKGQIDAVHATSDVRALGAVLAITAAGREDEIFVSAVDGDREAMRQIARGGCFAATVSQDFPLIGATQAHMIIDYLNKKPTPRYIWVPTVLVTKENVYDRYEHVWGEPLKLES